ERCGDGVQNPGEQCDDGNRADGDGCTSFCVIERCGDFIVNHGTEGCDDGNTVSGDGCSSTCHPEGCGASPCQTTGCGNGIVEAGEQ
ncbi:DUF4215 domain-containing protein, partial [Klebsiella pneumoniae]|nr:DUF4215 domain-containing protein [Klebsiella pneumoniae]